MMPQSNSFGGERSRKNREVNLTVKQGSPRDDELKELGSEIADNWVKLGHRLGVKKPKLQDIKQRHGQLWEKGYLMLLEWKEEYGSAATYQTLNVALRHKRVRRIDLAEKICYKDVSRGSINVQAWTSSAAFFQEQVPAGSLKQGSPTDDELEELAKEIAEKWMRLGRRLRVKEPKLQDIKQSHRQLCERGYHMLLEWKQEYGSAATYKTLNVALRHKLMQRKDLAEKICYKNVSRGSISVEAWTSSAAFFQEQVPAGSSSRDYLKASTPSEASRQALKRDKRVKVPTIGPDRVGKTSLGKSLRDEPFNAEEPSTDGAQMSLPIASRDYLKASTPSEASRQALKRDKRVKVPTIGPDRVGKTSLGKSLRDEPFNAEEPSTDGAQMSLPIASRDYLKASTPSEASRQALKRDKRVKVPTIGPDRVGKTSLGKSLRDEPFNAEEPSTDGAQMSLPIASRDYLEASIPSAAFCRALKHGEICDKRVKVSIIGPDRVGKTSLGKFLRGEPFNAEEPSTDGVQMSLPIKNASTKPWRNVDLHQHTTAFDHKCAEMIVQEKQATSTEQQMPSEAENHIGEEAIVKEEVNRLEEQNRQTTQIGTPVHVMESEQASEEAEVKSTLGEDLIKSRSKEIAALMEDRGNGSEGKSTLGEDLIKSRSKEIAALMEDRDNGSEGVWPVIWDFAGQAVYHAIHPLFMSPEAIYLLVVDLTKELSDLAQSFVKVDGHNEERASSPECEDTNLDSIIRWLTLVHSIKEQDGKSTSRSVILVGAKADKVKGDPSKKMKSLVKTLSRHCPRTLLKHIVYAREDFVVDNTKAGTLYDEQNQTIARLRYFILEISKEMPHTKEKKPLQWLSAELAIKEIVRQRGPYVSRRTFKHDIVEKCCTRSADDDVEGLLHFLHARGTVVYHTPPEDPDGLVVLDPVWLVETITKIITATPSWRYPPDHQCLYDRLKDTGILSKELLDFACEELDITAIKKSFIFIMEKFNLLFEWKSKHHGLNYIVPCMLSRRREVDVDTALGPLPLCLRFDESSYVPFGLFPRLVGLFGIWASEQCTAEQPDLSSNAASFFIDEKCQLHLVCFSSLIKLYVCVEVTCDQDETVSFCVSILRELKESLVKLKGECHWLGSVLLKYYVRCELCSTFGSLPCARHSKRECSHDDCAHYIDLEKKPLVCRKKPCRSLSESFKEKCTPWIKALEVINRKEIPSHEASTSGEAQQTLCTQPRDGKSIDARQSGLALEQRCLAQGSDLPSNSFDLVTTRYVTTVVPLPDAVVESILTPSCDAEKVVLQLKENLQLSQVDFEQPCSETRMMIRSLARKATASNRLDIFNHLRKITPAGSTGPLLAENLQVRDIPDSVGRKLTMNLSGRDDWKLLAEALRLTPGEVQFFDQRTLNPVLEVLVYVSKQRSLSVGELYDLLNENGFHVLADFL